MSARTRSSTRIQALHNVDDTEDDNEEQPISLEEKEQEVWDEIRDEHYDIIEQLPLTIHRQFTLLRQLDNQAHDYSSGLLPAIKQYIELRQRLAAHSNHPTQSERIPSPQASSSHGGKPSPHTKAKAKLPTTSREMLSHIACLSEEYLRTSREKVNLAQTAHDSVDRHIRLLDQFIKEQEASLGPEPNAPVMLSMSELFVPKWSRSTRVSMSPMFDEEEMAPVPPTQSESSMPPERSKRRPPKNRKQKEKEKEKEKPDLGTAATLTITLPPQHQDVYVDPNEPTWCYCNRVSFGEMIGCDDPECKYEWFHLECVGLKEVPEDEEWHCRECTQRREAKNRRR
ncbi:hypothetical protein P691DRAFT_146595 [Macrolepiota fuliginosa MF-IS2]|uniref:Chromatin modification-related protein n=1 Tax=Macrolepiota fuliginosa MF-IS2 TaxID=1400762 RepID=A0A9P5XLV9_9AGAR|nr:hypothetical protein P691DRAFT_146595 [Macrolepiota fuliginosa MF-IS2]